MFKIKIKMDEMYLKVMEIVYTAVFAEYVVGGALYLPWKLGLWEAWLDNDITIGIVGGAYLLSAGVTHVILGLGITIIYLAAQLIGRAIRVHKERYSTYCDDYDDIKVEII